MTGITNVRIAKRTKAERPKRTKDKKNGKKLTPKQEAFAAEYIKNGGNATQAAKDAGYAEARAAITGCENVRKSNISESIAEQMERIEKEQHRDIMSLAEIQERRSMIAKGMLRDGEGYTPEFKDQLKAMDGLEKALTIAEKQRIERRRKKSGRKHLCGRYQSQTLLPILWKSTEQCMKHLPGR